MNNAVSTRSMSDVKRMIIFQITVLS